MHRVTAVVVNWNSGKDLARVVKHLTAQTGVTLSILVIDNGSTDASVATALATGIEFRLESTGQNLGYAGGNNFALTLVAADEHLFIINPDVRLPDATTVAGLLAALEADDTLAAVAPGIQTDRGCAEYLDSEIDLERARAVHTQTDVLFPQDTEPRVVSWIDGAALLIRPEARKQVGLFDDRFFLFSEEVDWCLRASAAGWRVALCPAVRVRHRRSSSFAGSTKGAYYYWRNLYLVCQIHAASRWTWRWHWAKDLARYVIRPVVFRSGNSATAARGGLDAVRGRFGPGPADRPGPARR